MVFIRCQIQSVDVNAIRKKIRDQIKSAKQAKKKDEMRREPANAVKSSVYSLV